MRKFALLLVCLWLSVAASPGCAAPARTFWQSSLHHMGWTKKDGAPQWASLIAQDSKGMLWFGAPDGLYRFDGVKFERIEQINGQPLAGGAISSLQTVGDALWIGYRFGGVTRVSGQQVRHYGIADGLPGRSVAPIAASPDGSVWVGTSEGVYYRQGERWQRVREEQGLPASHTVDLHILPDASVLVFNREGIFRSTGSAHQFRKISPVVVEFTDFCADGRMLLKSSEQRFYDYDPGNDALRPRQMPDLKEPILQAAQDRRGGTWVQTASGIYLLNQSQQVKKKFTVGGGFTGRSMSAVFEDREGNFWVATEAGIDRVRESRLNTVGMGTAMPSSAIMAGAHGEIWIANTSYYSTVNSMLTRRAPDGLGRPFEVPYMTAWLLDDSNALWMAGLTELRRLQGDRYQAWPLPASRHRMDVQAMAFDHDGGLWVSIVRSGLYVFRDGKWTRPPVPAALASETPLTMTRDPQGRLWLGFAQNRLVVIDRDGGVSEYGAAHGIAVGSILTIVARGDHVWIAGDQGLSRWDGKRFMAFRKSTGRFGGVSGLVETSGGDVWLHGSDGVIHISHAAILAAMQMAEPVVAVDVFDHLDGYEGIPEQIRPLPTLTAGADGRIWYATTAQVGWIDPQHILKNTLPPIPQIVSMSADDGRHMLTGLSVLPPGAKNLQFDFTAASLSIPERVRFRYRLVGLDERWHDAGARRQVFYTNLAPGRYQFEVLASNEDGVWSAAPAIARFALQPSFVQSVWFAVLCIAALFVAGYGLLRWRVRLATARGEERMRERLAERMRIARTLHDTFLQSQQALIMKIEWLKCRLPAADPAREALDKALGLAEAVADEGRQQVFTLRSQETFGGDLSAAVSDFTRELAEQYGVSVKVCVEGRQRLIKPGLAEQICAVLREAANNACRHSGSKVIVVELCYGRWTFLARVLDEGQGIAQEILAAGGKHGHWGIVGMRERAEQIGAVLTLSARQHGGTQVCLKLSATALYTVPLQAA